MLSHLRDTILETVFTMPDDLRMVWRRIRLAQRPSARCAADPSWIRTTLRSPTASTPTCMRRARSTLAAGISPSHPPGVPRDDSNTRPDLAVTGREITADKVLTDLEDVGATVCAPFDRTKEESLRTCLLAPSR